MSNNDFSPSLFDLGAKDSDRTWFWRQNAELVQLIVELGEDESLRRDVTVELGQNQLSVVVSGCEICAGALAHSVVKTESTWYVDLGDVERESNADDDDDDDDARLLVVELKKQEPFVNWAQPCVGAVGASGAAAAVRAPLSGADALKQQGLNFDRLVKRGGTSCVADTYARLADANADDRTFFIGKVAAEEPALLGAALTAQAPLLKAHARKFLAHFFDVEDDAAIVLFEAPGNTELSVAQDEFGLTPAAPAAADDGADHLAFGFEPEPFNTEDAKPFYCFRTATGATLGDAERATFVSAPPTEGSEL